MRIALIPPIPNLQAFPSTGTHLLLSHLLDVPAYVAWYKWRSTKGDYLILDNSAHEYGRGNAPDMLLKQVALVGAKEVVSPDVLFDSSGTVEATKRMLRYITDPKENGYWAAGRPRLMLVPQGTNRSDWVRCLRTLVDTWGKMIGFSVPPVIGVSKDYDELVSGGISTLISRYLYPLYEEYGIDVHCLGWPSNLWSLAEVQKENPWVRSTDSAKPFVYAKAGILLEPGGKVPKYPHRSPDYFTSPLEESSLWIAQRNVAVFHASATNVLVAR